MRHGASCEVGRIVRLNGSDGPRLGVTGCLAVSGLQGEVISAKLLGTAYGSREQRRSKQLGCAE